MSEALVVALQTSEFRTIRSPCFLVSSDHGKVNIRTHHSSYSDVHASPGIEHPQNAVRNVNDYRT